MHKIPCFTPVFLILKVPQPNSPLCLQHLSQGHPSGSPGGHSQTVVEQEPLIVSSLATELPNSLHPGAALPSHAEGGN